LARLGEHFDVLLVETCAEARVFGLNILLDGWVLHDLLGLLKRNLGLRLFDLQVVLGHAGFSLLKLSIFHINLNPLAFPTASHLVNWNYHSLRNICNTHLFEISARQNLVPLYFDLAGVEFDCALKL